MNDIEYLKSKHEMAGNLFSMTSSLEDTEKYRLSEEAIQSYHEKGYLPNHEILNQFQVDALEDSLETNLRKLFEENFINGSIHV